MLESGDASHQFFPSIHKIFGFDQFKDSVGCSGSRLPYRINYRFGDRQYDFALKSTIGGEINE